MAIKLVLVLSLVFFLCCVVVAPAGEFQPANTPNLMGNPAAMTFSGGFLVGGVMEELCGCAGEAPASVSLRDLLDAPDVVISLRRSASASTNLSFVSSSDALRGSHYAMLLR